MNSSVCTGRMGTSTKGTGFDGGWCHERKPDLTHAHQEKICTSVSRERERGRETKPSSFWIDEKIQARAREIAITSTFDEFITTTQ